MPLRTSSVIVTIYGDAILPRGGAWALSDLLVLLRRLGMADGMVRTAVSRLARDGVLQGQRVGRRSAYALTDAGESEFSQVVPRIYGGMHGTWSGHLTLAFPEPGADRLTLEQAGFAVLAPGVLAGAGQAPDRIPALHATGSTNVLQHLASRAWPIIGLANQYRAFVDAFRTLDGEMPPHPLDAMAARLVLIHAWRRIALRDPHLPNALLPPRWPGDVAYTLCRALYDTYASASEAWLDTTSAGSAALPRGADPAARFSGGDTPPAASASSPAPAGSRHPRRSTET